MGIPAEEEREKGAESLFKEVIVVRIQHFHCRDPGSIPGRGTEVLQAAWLGQERKE